MVRRDLRYQKKTNWLVILSLCFLAIALGAYAGYYYYQGAQAPAISAKETAQEKQDVLAPNLTRCPVCGVSVNPLTPAKTLTANDRTFYFCSDKCYVEFLNDPAKYIPGLRIKINVNIKPRQPEETMTPQTAETTETTESPGGDFEPGPAPSAQSTPGPALPDQPPQKEEPPVEEKLPI